MFSFVADTVLDPFMGTGTTSLACARWGRNSIGIELDEEYYELARHLDPIYSARQPSIREYMSMKDLDVGVRHAVRHFWQTRQQQSTRQGEPEDKDRGSRGAVTGGKQMDGFVRLVRELLVAAKVPDACIAIEKRIELPGWFRAEKKWDLVVVHESQLLAALEFKSQVGPSFGNNFNNRTEEALGSATDIWAAYREGAFKPSSRPFLGYLMLLKDCERSRTPVKLSQPHFPVFPEFKTASYRDRYAILIEKLLRDRLYDSARFLLSNDQSGASGAFLEPHPELTIAKFVTPLVAHVSAICSTPSP